jgi:hypothetical protein
VALGDKLEIRARAPAGTTDKFGPDWPIALLQRSHTRSATRQAIAAIFPL